MQSYSHFCFMKGRIIAEILFFKGYFKKKGQASQFLGIGAQIQIFTIQESINSKKKMLTKKSSNLISPLIYYNSRKMFLSRFFQIPPTINKFAIQNNQLQFSRYKAMQQQGLPFTVIVPGSAPITNFNCDNQVYHVDLENPGSIPNICVTLTSPLPDNIGLCVYFSLPPYTSLQYLGVLYNARPSEILSTGFPLRTEVASKPTVKLCLRGQTYEEIQELMVVSDGKKQYTIKVAQNLYNYMMSYNKSGMLVNGNDGEYLVIPSNFLDRWLQKFQEKYKRDPNFIMKTTSN